MLRGGPNCEKFFLTLCETRPCAARTGTLGSLLNITLLRGPRKAPSSTPLASEATRQSRRLPAAEAVGIAVSFCTLVMEVDVFAKNRWWCRRTSLYDGGASHAVEFLLPGLLRCFFIGCWERSRPGRNALLLAVGCGPKHNAPLSLRELSLPLLLTAYRRYCDGPWDNLEIPNTPWT